MVYCRPSQFTTEEHSAKRMVDSDSGDLVASKEGGIEEEKKDSNTSSAVQNRKRS
jgi:Mu-like prophage protein gp29